MVSERPTRHIAPALALTKQPREVSFGDAGSLSRIDFCQQFGSFVHTKTDGRVTVNNSVDINIY